MRSLLVVPAASVVVVFFANVARADDENRWLDRPLTLKTAHVNVEAGLGFGQYVASDATTKLGTASNLEAAVGLPFFGELRVRSGFRFAHTPDPKNSNGDVFAINDHPDYYARLFDHETVNSGYGDWASPEISLHGSIVDEDVAAVGLETRVTIPVDQSSDYTVSPGLPVRFRIPDLMRIDTGIFAPIGANARSDYIVSVPVQAWFQVENAFFGPMSGFRFVHLKNGLPSHKGIPAGIGGGYTFAKHFDVKAQLYAADLNQSNWGNTLGVGLGVGVTFP